MRLSPIIKNLILRIFTRPAAQYLRTYPHPQAALDLYAGEWASALPVDYAMLRAGSSPLFDDARIHWFASEIGGFEGCSVLELGPLEGGHSYMMETMGASRVVAVEGNDRGYQKCLIIKELLQLQRVRFLYGDFLAYLREEKEPAFDVALASGVLYHMVNPVELLALLAATPVRHILLWTHYYDESVIAASPRLRGRFSKPVTREVSGFKHRLYRQNYGASVLHGKFCGGPELTSNWMSSSDIVDALAFFGFGNVRINFNEPNHQNGPAFALTATRNNPV